MALALAVLFGYVVTQLRAVGETAQRTQDLRVAQLTTVAHAELGATQASMLLRHAMLARTPDERRQALEQAAEKLQNLQTQLHDYEARLFSPEAKAQFAAIPAQQQAFARTVQDNLALVDAIEFPSARITDWSAADAARRSAQVDKAFAFLVDTVIPVRNQLLASLEAGVALQTNLMQAEIEHMRDTLRAIAWAVGSAILAIVLLLLGSALGVGRSLRGRTQQALQVAQRVRDGDLSQPVHDGARDELSPLLAALQEMQDALVGVVSRVRQGSEGVASASTQIAQGNHDLSSRTESQASALQQTAASMEQLNSNVRQNADNARQANQLAQSASGVAAQGGVVVQQVVDTMQGIDEASRRIADIIGVIDGIAFQTNILALNAAVEAARAGDAGRGFAVVASEVRALAGRSADAAKEIKGLIDTSVQRVQAGTSLVDQAGQTMAEVVQSIQRVTDIMGEISAASGEQSQGVAQVSEAVTQMDQTTQQNAALVEETAAAASSLNQQAQELLGTVAVFRLADATPVPTPVRPLAPPAAAAPLRTTPRAPLPKVAAKVAAKSAPKALTAQAKADADQEWEGF